MLPGTCWSRAAYVPSPVLKPDPGLISQKTLYPGPQKYFLHPAASHGCYQRELLIQTLPGLLCQRVCTVSQANREDGFFTFLSPAFFSEVLRKASAQFSFSPWSVDVSLRRKNLFPFFCLNSIHHTWFHSWARSVYFFLACFLESKWIETRSVFWTPSMRKAVE